MRSTKSPRPLSMERVRRRLEHWRQTRAHLRAPIPKNIWAGAVALARQHGLYQTARALPLNYGGLEQPLGAADPTGRGRGRTGRCWNPAPDTPPPGASIWV